MLGSQVLQALKDTNVRSFGGCFEVGEEGEAEQKGKQEAGVKLFAVGKRLFARDFHLKPFPTLPVIRAKLLIPVDSFQGSPLHGVPLGHGKWQRSVLGGCFSPPVALPAPGRCPD